MAFPTFGYSDPFWKAGFGNGDGVREMQDGAYYMDELQPRSRSDLNRQLMGAMLMQLSTVGTPNYNPAAYVPMMLQLRQQHEAHNARIRRLTEPRVIKVGDELIQREAPYKWEGDRLVKQEPEFTSVYRPETSPAAPFQGSGMEAQALNIHLDPTIPDDDPRKVLARQRLQRAQTVTTPQGTYTTPGYDLGTAGPTGVPTGFTEKPLTDAERRAEYTVGSMREFDQLATGYVPKLSESLASTFAGDAEGFLTSSDYKEFREVADEWARSLVFLQSGVTARADEVESKVRTYWPRPGDTPEDVARKARNRQIAMRNAERLMRERESDSDTTQTLTWNPETGEFE